MKAYQLTPIIVERQIGPIEKYAHNCHAASLALVKSGLLDSCRVARGAAIGVPGQHSWVVEGMDVYDPQAPIVDLTLWSYENRPPRIKVGKFNGASYRPHFWGSILDFGCPVSGGMEEIVLTPERELSMAAREWLSIFREQADGPLDTRFWARLLSHAPHGGWPSAEITLAAWQTPGLRALIPIDRVGMETDVNPGGLYLLDGAPLSHARFTDEPGKIR